MYSGNPTRVNVNISRNNIMLGKRKIFLCSLMWIKWTLLIRTWKLLCASSRHKTALHNYDEFNKKCKQLIDRKKLSLRSYFKTNFFYLGLYILKRGWQERNKFFLNKWNYGIANMGLLWGWRELEGKWWRIRAGITWLFRFSQKLLVVVYHQEDNESI